MCVQYRHICTYVIINIYTSSVNMVPLNSAKWSSTAEVLTLQGRRSRASRAAEKAKMLNKHAEKAKIEEISFGGIPNSRDVLLYFYKSFWSVLGSQALETPQLIFHELNEPDLAWLLQPSPEPVEPDLAVHQGFLEPSPEPSLEPCWTWPGCTKASQTFSGTFSGTLLNLTWLWAKASQTFSGTFSGTLLNLTWLCTKASQTFSGTFSGTRWTWLGFTPRLPGTFSGSLLGVTWLCTKASRTCSGTFGTFSRTSLNLTRRLRQCTPELFWAEDPLAYAVRDKSKFLLPDSHLISKPYSDSEHPQHHPHLGSFCLASTAFALTVSLETNLEN